MVSRFLPPNMKEGDAPNLSAGLEQWRTCYCPHEVSAVSVKGYFAEGCILPTLQQVEDGGKPWTVVYVRWCNFKPYGPDVERKQRTFEFLAFMLEHYQRSCVTHLLFVYDYTKWGPSQSEPSTLADYANLIGRYNFESRHCIVDAPTLFTPLWMVIKATLPSYMLAKVEFISSKQLPAGVTCEAACASSLEWLASVEPILKPVPFLSKLAALQKLAATASPPAARVMLKAGGNNLLSRSSSAFQTRHFFVLDGGDGGPTALAYNNGGVKSGSGGNEYKRVYPLAGARCREAPLPSERSSSRFSSSELIHPFQLEFADGQVLNLAAKTAEEKTAFLEACGAADRGSSGD